MAMRVTRNRFWWSLALAVVTAAWAGNAWSGQGARQYKFDIGAAPFTSAVKEFSRQSGLQVVYIPANPAEESIIVGPVVGEYTADAALVELVRPLGAKFSWVNEHTIAIVSPRRRRPFR
jgi:hypothetical protein